MATADPMTRILEAIRNVSSKAQVELTVENGDKIKCNLAYGQGPDQPTIPSLALEIQGGAPTSGREPTKLTQTTDNEVESFTFTSGTTVYQVTERDIDSVNSLTATVSGSSTTLTEGTDFEIHSTSDYATNDAIKFLDGGTKPDDGTSFSVDYEHKLYRRDTRARGRRTFRLTLRVPRLQSGEEGASVAYEPTHLGWQLHWALMARMMTLQGTNLWPTAAQDATESNPADEPGQLVLGGAQSIGRRPTPEDSSYAEFVVEGELKTIIRAEGKETRALGKIDPSTTEELG